MNKERERLFLSGGRNKEQDMRTTTVNNNKAKNQRRRERGGPDALPFPPNTRHGPRKTPKENEKKRNNHNET
jgi:hypothetical protein